MNKKNLNKIRIKKKGNIINRYFIINKIFMGHRHSLYDQYLHHNKQSVALASFFYRIGFLSLVSYEQKKAMAVLRIYYHYSMVQPLYRKLIFISKPSKRVYVPYDKLTNYLKRYHSCIVVVSTSKGYLTLLECILYGVGGEFICAIC